MDTRPKTSRGIPAYGSGGGGVGGFGGIKPVGGRLSTEELLKRASGHLRGGESGSRGGEGLVGSSADFYGAQVGRKDLNRVTSSYDANRKVRSSTETYLNNLSRKASKASQDKSDDEEQRKPQSSAGKKKSKPSRKQDRGVAGDSDASEDNLHSFGGDTTSSSTTLGKGGAAFLKKKPTTTNPNPTAITKKTGKSSVKTAKAVDGSGLLSSSDDDLQKRLKGKQGKQVGKRDQISRRVIEDPFSEDDGDDRIKFTKTEGEDSLNEEKSDDDLDRSIDIDALINEQPSTETSSGIKKEEDEEYDNFDAESPPKTPVSARKEVRFSTQLSIASGEENISVVESVMDTESIQMGGGGTGEGNLHADHKSQSGHKSYGKDVAGGSMKGLLGDGGAARVSSLFQDSDLEMEVNLGIEDILPATVKPDKSLPPDSPSDPEDPFDNHIQDINDLVVASDSPSPTLKHISAKHKDRVSKRSSRSHKKHKRLSSFRTSSRSSTTSASEDDVMEEIVSASENEISIVAGTNEIKTDDNSYTSHEEQLMSIGKLPEPSAKLGVLGGKSAPPQNSKGMLLIESEKGTVDERVQNEKRNIEDSIATEVQSTEELKINDIDNGKEDARGGGEELGVLDDSRRSSRVSLYSQDSFDEVSTTEPPFSDTNIDESESDVTLMDKEMKEGRGGGGGGNEGKRDKNVIKRDDVSSVTSRDTTDDYSDSQSDSATDSFPSYSPNLESKAERRLKKSRSSEGKFESGKAKTEIISGSRGERSSNQMTAEEYFAERETATSIDRVFHQIVTIQPRSIASMVVEKDTIDAMTNYNPSSVALTAFMRNHLDATRTFIENTRRLHEQYQKLLIPDYNYTNMDQAKAEITATLEAENNRSLEVAIDRVELQMGRSFSEKKRQKIREKVHMLKNQRNDLDSTA